LHTLIIKAKNRCVVEFNKSQYSIVMDIISLLFMGEGCNRNLYKSTIFFLSMMTAYKDPPLPTLMTGHENNRVALNFEN